MKRAEFQDLLLGNKNYAFYMNIPARTNIVLQYYAVLEDIAGF